MPDARGIQVIGMRFNNLTSHRAPTLSSAFIQFETDETRNDDPCNLTIYGIASDNAATFLNTDFDISSLPHPQCHGKLGACPVAGSRDAR